MSAETKKDLEELFFMSLFNVIIGAVGLFGLYFGFYILRRAEDLSGFTAVVYILYAYTWFSLAVIGIPSCVFLAFILAICWFWFGFNLAMSIQ